MSGLNNLDVAIYLRKSRADVDAEKEAAARGENYDTLSKHRTELLSVARRDGHNVIDILEDVVSGEFIAERPEMQILLRNVKNMQYDAVLVMDIDRLGRGDKIDQGRIEKAFKDAQTLIITPSEVYDLNSESGEFSVEVKAFLSRMEYKQIRKRLYGGRIRAQKEGKDLGTKPPYGFKKNRDKRLVIFEEEAKIVRLIYQWCIEGVGRIQTAERLIEMGVPNPTGKRIWSHVTVRKILDNPKYKGDQIFGRYKWTKREDGSYKVKYEKDYSKLTIAENAHEPIVDTETWQRAQEAIKKRNNAPVKANVEMINPFAGVLRCKKCGNAILANNPANRPNAYLYCDTPRCYQKRIALSKVEEVLLRQLEQTLEGLKMNIRYLKQKKQESETIVELAVKRVDKIKEEIEKTHRRKLNLHDLLEDGTYDKATFLDRMRLVQEKLAQLNEDLQKAEKKANMESERYNQASKVIPNMQKAITSYRSTKSAKEKNMILKSFIKEIRYNREKEWKGAYQFELEIELYE